jgi:hypothetical protein
MDQNRTEPKGQSNQVSTNARGQQQSRQQWDGHERRMGTPDRRQQGGGQRQSRNTSADIQMMNEGSSR